MSEIPIISLDDLGLHNEEEITRETINRVSRELYTAFSNVGFVYLLNHGVDKKLVEDVFESSRSFFNHSKEIKDSYSWDMLNFNGYTCTIRQIIEGKHFQGIRETYDATSADSIFPDEQSPNLRPSMCSLATQLCRLTTRLLKCMSLEFGLGEDYLGSRHQFMFSGKDKNGTSLRTLYYPALPDEDFQTSVFRCGEHTDFGTITLILQDEMGGLEILLKNNEWIPAPPIPGTILVNLGGLMQYWTSDRYKATVHRVRVPEEELRRRCSRQSIALFVNPDNGVVIYPLDEKSSTARPPIEVDTYLKGRLSETYK